MALLGEGIKEKGRRMLSGKMDEAEIKEARRYIGERKTDGERNANGRTEGVNYKLYEKANRYITLGIDGVADGSTGGIMH